MLKIKNLLSIKSLVPNSLLGRSLLILIIPVLLIQIFTSFMFFDRHWSKMTSRLAYGIAAEIAQTVRKIEAAKSSKELEQIKKDVAQDFEFTLTYEENHILGPEHGISSMYIWNSMATQNLTEHLRDMLHKPFVLDIDFEDKKIRISIELEKGVANITLSGRRILSSTTYIFLLWMIGSSLLLLLIAVVFMRNQIRPIRKLAIAAERFGKGRDVPAFKPSGAREIRQAAESFMRMHKRIHRQIEQRTAMLAGVSHDLRTPLTRLKLQLEMMPETEDTKYMKEDVKTMQNMLDGYLDFVRGDGDEQPVYTNINNLIDRIISNADRQNIKIANESQPNLNITIRPNTFERCLTNLISNAGKYADHVWIEAFIEDETMRFIIEDNGPGIPEKEYEEVFKPFYRVDTSRNLDTGGIGLGLPIAMDIVHAHGGKIWLDRSQHGGLQVCINLPL